MDGEGFGQALVAMLYFAIAAAFIAGFALASVVALAIYWFGK